MRYLLLILLLVGCNEAREATVRYVEDDEIAKAELTALAHARCFPEGVKIGWESYRTYKAWSREDEIYIVKSVMYICTEESK